MSEDREPGTDVPPSGRQGPSDDAPAAHAPEDEAASASSRPPGPLPSPFGPAGWVRRPPRVPAAPASSFGDLSADGEAGAADRTDRAGDDQRRPPRSPALFSLEGRPAPGLYVLAWLLAVAGLGLVVVGGSAASGAAGTHAGVVPTIFVLAGAFALMLACAAASGYQVVARRTRPADRYRGPSPLFAFAVTVLGVVLVGAPLAAAGVLTPASGAFGTLIAEAVTVAGYVLVVWVFAVRTGALSWPDMGWPPNGRVGASRLAADVVAGVGLIVPTYLATVIVAALLAGVLHVTTPEVIPAPRSSADALAAIVTAVILAPIGEETFFRGFALTAWWRDLGMNAALLRATLLFAGAHILNVTASTSDWAQTALLQFVVIVPVGYALGWLFTQRGILASIAGHMTFNAISVGLLIATAAAR